MYREQTHHLRPERPAVAWRLLLLPLFLLALAVFFLPAAGLLAAQAEAVEEQVEDKGEPADEPEEATDKADSETDSQEEGKGETESKDEAERKPEKSDDKSRQEEGEKQKPAEEQGKTKDSEETQKMPSSKEPESEESKPANESKASVETERPQEVDPPPKKTNQGDKKNEPPKKEKCIIGATATLVEKQTGLKFRARVDSGAKSCSLHIEKPRIEDASKKEAIAERMTENIGKLITFQVKNGDGKTHILKRKIAGYVIIKTSDKSEGKRRYKVPMTFLWKNMEKEVLVTLNDRNHMEYPLLLGRNFLRGDFLVDVELNSDD